MEAAPTGSRVMAQATEHNQSLFNRHAAEAIGEQGDRVTGEMLRNARERIGGVFNRIMSPDRGVMLGPDFVRRVEGIAAENIEPYLGSGATPITQTVERTLEAARRGEVSADWLMSQASRLGKQGRQAMRGESSNPTLGHALLDIQDALLDAGMHSLPPEERAAFNIARQQYRNLMTLRQGNNVNAETGNVSAPLVANFLQRRDYRGFLEGANQSPFYEGARFLGRLQTKLPSSGTAERMGMIPLLGAGGVGGLTAGNPGTAVLAAGAAAAPYLAARAYMAPGFAPYLSRVPGATEQAVLRAMGLTGAQSFELGPGVF